jgi:peptide/nickel transport system permease protein
VTANAAGWRAELGEAMRAYLSRRLLWAIPTIVIVSLLTFVALRILPGDIATLYLNDDARPEDVENFKRQHGLDEPLPLQYWRWISGAARGDFGTSLRGGFSIRSEIAQRFPVTLEILILSLLFTTIFGVGFGLIAALWQDRWPDYLVRVSSIVNQSVPDFFLLTLLILIPALLWSYAPPVGYDGAFWHDPWRNAKQFIPPVLILSLGNAAFLMRVTRSAMLEVLRTDYIRTARAKGVRESAVIRRHAIKNALIPVVTLVGATFATLLGGSVILENVMTLPGLGQYTFNAVNQRDLAIVQTMTLYAAVVVIGVHLLVDLLYAVIDPRIRYR